MHQTKLNSSLIKANERTKIIQRLSNSIPESFTLSFETLNGEPLTGYLEVEKSALVLDKKLERLALQAELSLHKGYWDAFYSVYVITEQDTRVSYKAAFSRARSKVVILAFVICFIALGFYVLSATSRS